MSREGHKTQQVALLATGDEITNGDIINSNTKEIAHRLFNLGINVGLHMTAADHTPQIQQAIEFLLENHEALIITGGLGPTSDDLTRYALSQAIKKNLVFDAETWDNIVKRLQRFGYPQPPESNRQQALFPAGSIIIPNVNGTAAGCLYQYNTKFIFMLPGPPMECLPMVDEVVLPTLEKKHFAQPFFHHSWLLFGVSEGQIGEELDALTKPYNCITGYRLAYPYLEFKIQSKNKIDFNTVLAVVSHNIKKYLISDGTQTASQAIREKLSYNTEKIIIIDEATKGLLAATILSPQNYQNILFSNEVDSNKHFFRITGLDAFWHQEQNTVKTDLHLEHFYQHKNSSHDISLPFRGEQVKKYAVEWICYQILKVLT